MRQPDERFAKVGEVELCYEELGSPDGEPMVMVMGLATQMIGWHEDFCEELGGRGFRVIRFDNRDVGRSTRMDGEGVPNTAAMMLGLGDPAYRLADLAGDAVGLLDALEIESAHVVGASMGGMIAQTMAIEQPRRVRSLASIMSGTGSRWTRMPRLRALGTLLRAAPNDREGFIEYTVKTFEVIGSPGFERDEERLREVAGMSFDRGRYPQGIARQMHAVTSSPSRERRLRQVRAPTAVIHGADDPLVRLSGGKATARAVPDSRLTVIDGMGHDLPRGAWSRIIDAITENVARVGEPGTARSAGGRAAETVPR